jgi:fucose permease
MVLNSAMLLGVLVLCSFNLLPADIDKQAEGPKIVLPRGRLLTLGLLCLGSFLAEGGVIDWGVTYVRNSLGATAEIGAICTAMSAFFMAAGRFVGDGFVHRKGERWVLVLSGVLMSLGIWIAVNVPSPLAAIAGFCLAALGIANAVPLYFNAAGNQPGVSTGTGIAAVTSCGYAGFLLGPPIIGFVADARSLGFALGLIGIVGVVVALSGPAAVSRESQ